MPLDRAANLVFILNILLAGLAMFIAARRFLEEKLAALFCGVAYMLSYRYLALIDAGWLPTITMYALAPLLYWSADRMLDRPEPRQTAAFALILGLSAMQGALQSFYYALLGLGAFLCWRASSIPRGLRGRAALALAAGCALAFMLAAPDLLPRAQFAALSTRTSYDYGFFLATPPRWSSLATFLDPRDAGGARFEYWENNFYFGLWLYPLAAWACFVNWKKSRPLAAAFAFCVFLCFDSPLLKFLFHFFPGFALFRQSTRLLQLAQFAGVLLAGVGADSLLRGPWRRFPAAAAILCLLPIIDSGARMFPRLKTKPLAEAFPEPAFADQLRRSPMSGRVAAIGRTALPYGMAAYYGIDMVNGYQPLNLKHYIEYFSVLQTGDPRRVPRWPVVWTDLSSIAKPEMLRALDARHILANGPGPLEKIGYDFVGRREEVLVYKFYEGLVRVPVFLWRDRHPLGPAYFAASLTPARDENESLSALASSSSVLDARVFGWDGTGKSALDLAGGSARMTRRGENVYEYELDSRGRNYLILSQIWYPGWRATLNGEKRPVYRTNHALIGLFVPPGRHKLVLEMASPALTAGLVLFAFAIISLVALLWSSGTNSAGVPKRASE